MKRLQSQYPLGQLLIAVFQRSQLRLPDFMAAIGYGNSAKGIRTFQEVLSTGRGNPIFFDRLQSSPYAIPEDLFKEIFFQNWFQLDHEFAVAENITIEDPRKVFRPLVHAVTDVGSSYSLTLFALTSGWESCAMTLPRSIHRWPVELQHQYVGRRIRENKTTTQSRAGSFGAITHYLFFRTWEGPPLAFSTDGEFLGLAEGSALPRFALYAGKRRLCEQLLDRAVTSAYGQPIH